MRWRVGGLHCVTSISLFSCCCSGGEGRKDTESGSFRFNLVHFCVFIVVVVVDDDVRDAQLITHWFREVDKTVKQKYRKLLKET